MLSDLNVVIRKIASTIFEFNFFVRYTRLQKPVQSHNDFLEFKNRIFKRVPQCKIVLIPVKPSPKRLEIIETERALNKLLADEAAKDDRLVLIEGMFDTLLNANGQPDETLFLNDRLHLNQAGYARWTKLLRPQLVK